MIHALEERHDPRRKVRGVSPRDRRSAVVSLTIRISPSRRDELYARASAELRSLSGFVGRVFVEALARKPAK